MLSLNAFSWLFTYTFLAKQIVIYKPTSQDEYSTQTVT